MRLRLAGALLALAFLASGCALQPFQPTVRFESLEADTRVQFEPGAMDQAQRVAALLPQAVVRVEAAHYLPFAGPVTVHVCGTDACFDAHVTRRNVSAATVPDNRVFLAPRLFTTETHRLPLILAHELSHLHLGQRIGHYSPAVPVWFHEGLAAYASDGGGADYASEDEARAALAAGHAFAPDVLDSAERRHGAEAWNLSPHLFYRQAMMFLQHLKAAGEERFRDFLLRVQAREDFAAAFATTYNMTLGEAGRRFLQTFSRTATAAAPTD